jgi:uncharacterized membrane protein
VSVPSEVIDEVAVISPAVRVVIVALVVVELPTMRSVMFARVARRLEKNPVVVVLLVTEVLVIVALVAKMFSAKRLRNLLSDVPIL